jgi:hypothetical protein
MGLHNPAAAQQLFWTGGMSRIWSEFDIQIPTLPDATNDFIAWFGFGGSVDTEPSGPQSGFAVKRADNATRWVYKSATAGTPVGVDTGVDVSTARTRLGIDITPGNSARFFINGVLGTNTDSTAGNIINAANTTFVPLFSNRWVAGASRSIRVDRVRWGVIYADANVR